MDKPLTQGEILDMAGLRLTPGQWRRASVVLEKMGFNCLPRQDGTMAILPPGQSDREEEEVEPNYGAA